MLRLRLELFVYRRESSQHGVVVTSLVGRPGAVRLRRADDVTGDDVTPLAHARREGARLALDGVGGGDVWRQRNRGRSLLSAGHVQGLRVHRRRQPVGAREAAHQGAARCPRITRGTRPPGPTRHPRSPRFDFVYK